jgi:hypothetical protein
MSRSEWSETVADAIREAAQRRPTHNCFTFADPREADRNYTDAEMLDAVRARAAALYALHTVPIYTHGPLQRSTKQLHLRRLLVVCSALGLCAGLLLFLHFAAADVPQPPPVNASQSS